MGYVQDAPQKVQDHTRAVICRGFVITPPSKSLGDALFAWTKVHDGAIGDMSLQFLPHGEDLASDWQDRPFVVGVFIREVFGLDGDHELGLTTEELTAKSDEADRRLDPLEQSLRELVLEHDAELSKRELLFTWGGPLCSAKLVKGVWREEADDADYYWSVKEGQPAFHFSREGASQDAAPGGAFGFEIAHGIYDNSDPPVVLTSKLLASQDAALAEHGITAPRIFAFCMYD